MDNKKIIIFGATGKIGKRVCDVALSMGYKIVEVGRKRELKTSDFHETDYKDFNSVLNTVNKTKLEEISAIVFAHRASLDENENEEDFHSALKIELNPYRAVKKALCTNTKERNSPLCIVTLTSSAQTGGAYDVDHRYHIIKGAQIAASKGLAYISTKEIYSNVVRFGEAIDESRISHSSYCENLFKNAEKIMPGKTLPTMTQIASLVVLLCKANELCISGVEIDIDGGLNSLSGAFFLRHGARV